MTSCVGPQKRVDFNQYNQGHWSSKVYLKNKKDNKSVFFDMKINAQYNDFLRLDIISPLGDPLGGFIVNKNQYQYLNIQDRSYYFGTVKEDTMTRLFNIPITPELIQNFLFDRPMPSTWVCRETKAPYSFCKNNGKNISIFWKKREGDERVIFIVNDKAQLKLSINAFKEQLELRKRLKEFKIPSSFKKIQL